MNPAFNKKCKSECASTSVIEKLNDFIMEEEFIFPVKVSRVPQTQTKNVIWTNKVQNIKKSNTTWINTATIPQNKKMEQPQSLLEEYNTFQNQIKR